MMKIVKGLIAVCLLNSFFVKGNTPNNDAEQLEEIETIEIRGVRPLSFFKKQFELSRIALYDGFNQLIEDPDMHFVCKRQKRKNSRLVETGCKHAFSIRISRELFDMEMRSSETLMEGLSMASASTQLGVSEIEKLTSEKNKMLVKLTEENKAFQQMVVNFNKAKYYYEKAHIDKYGSLSRFAKGEEKEE